jgi:hypothetical protein
LFGARVMFTAEEVMNPELLEKKINAEERL